MRIVVNMLQTLKPQTGVGRYAAQLFAALDDLLPPGSMHAFPTATLARLSRKLQTSRTGRSQASTLPTPLAHAGRLVQRMVRTVGSAGLGLAFRRACRREQYDIYHEPNFIPLPGAMPAIITVHDLSVLLHPEWHPAERVRHYEQSFARGIEQARHIMTDAECVRRELIDQLGVSPSRVTAVPIGIGQEFLNAGATEAALARCELGLPDDYLLCVGTIEPRKNVETLLRAYCDLPAGWRRRCPLVLAGGWGWKNETVAELVRANADSGVIHLGYTADRLLPGLYAGARALLCPSFYEGFGLPPLEMLGSGGAVIASTAAAHREVLGQRAHYLESLDMAGWRTAMARAITDEDWLAEVRRGGREYAARYTWARCAANTANVYRSVLGSTCLAA